MHDVRKFIFLRKNLNGKSELIGCSRSVPGDDSSLDIDIRTMRHWTMTASSRFKWKERNSLDFGTSDFAEESGDEQMSEKSDYEFAYISWYEIPFKVVSLSISCATFSMHLAFRNDCEFRLPSQTWCIAHTKYNVPVIRMLAWLSITYNAN